MVQKKLCWDANNVVGVSKQRKDRAGMSSSFALEVSLHYLHPSTIYSEPVVTRSCKRPIQHCLQGSVVKNTEGESTEANDLSHIL